MSEIKTNYIIPQLFEEIIIDVLSDLSNMAKESAKEFYFYANENATLLAMTYLYMNKEYDTDRAKVLFDYFRVSNPEFYNPERDGIIQYYFG